jgi:hypothetical protein
MLYLAFRQMSRTYGRTEKGGFPDPLNHSVPFWDIQNCYSNIPLLENLDNTP